MIVRAIVFVVVYMTVALIMYLLSDNKPGYLLLGIAFGIAGAVSSMIKIKVKKWF